MPPFQTASFLLLWDTVAEYLIMTDIVLIDSATVTGVAFRIGLLKNCKPPLVYKLEFHAAEVNNPQSSPFCHTGKFICAAECVVNIT